MQSEGFELRRGFFSSNELRYFKKTFNLKNSLMLSNEVLCLPIYPDLKKNQQEKMCDSLLKILGYS